MFTQNDLKQFQAKGIDLKTIEQQIENFKRGFPFVELVAPATPENGIKTFSEQETDKLITFYNKNAEDYEILKFVPASGAASRMFKHLFEFRENYKNRSDAEALMADKSFNSAYHFFTNIHNFAFFEDLKQIMQTHGLDIENCLIDTDYNSIIDFLLEDKGLGYAALPKAMLKFHNYSDGARMAMEEHLVEGANYGQNSDGRVAVHFTISPEHADRFIDEINNIKDKYEELFDVTYELTFSIQKSSTDTIAVDLKNKPFRNSDDSIVFRPGGHGALIENLNDRKGEVIFIKNIDNIVPDRLKDQTFRYKRVIGGYLIELRDKIFDYLEMLEDGSLTETEVKKITNFAKDKLYIQPGPDFDEMSQIEKIDFLYTKLNRPIRICGMVKNEGEPGGGPFWTKNAESEISLQIVESSQIDLDNPAQKDIFSKSSHFNPVDLVCYLRDFKGNQFDLPEFVDALTGFISNKSKDGRELKAQELPGLWNGAMADWITVFVEVPIITFNPVKTVNDLLRKEHQPAS
ncbi:MAG: DUF4301 family protein [Lentimicrobiaceae bacterium]|nr:DUF4301 family protein [Lentimicrobiaceae bacterium]MCB9024300.1 DUF4301 family protein [Lentimicrobiaceae bacterium]MCO5264735.1 DUF4301 family protein [Lentimicrobium sp.]HPG33037.1 DUF4301 family protein [Lentimicrobium sp.]